MKSNRPGNSISNSARFKEAEWRKISSRNQVGKTVLDLVEHAQAKVTALITLDRQQIQPDATGPRQDVGSKILRKIHAALPSVGMDNLLQDSSAVSDRIAIHTMDQVVKEIDVDPPCSKDKHNENSSGFVTSATTFVTWLVVIARHSTARMIKPASTTR